MKISRKILKFTEPLTYRRGWRRAQRSVFRVPLGPMLAEIDRERAREIQQRYANSTAGYAKYANIEPWLRLNRERVQDLKLHRAAPKRVLDLGCGGGFFLFILKHLGHSVLGLDVERVALFTELLFLGSIHSTTVITTRPSCAIFSSVEAQTSSANEFFLKRDCASNVLFRWRRRAATPARRSATTRPTTESPTAIRPKIRAASDDGASDDVALLIAAIFGAVRL